MTVVFHKLTLWNPQAIDGIAVVAVQFPQAGRGLDGVFHSALALGGRIGVPISGSAQNILTNSADSHRIADRRFFAEIDCAAMDLPQFSTGVLSESR